MTLWRLDEEEESGRRSAHFRGHRAPVVCLDGDGEKIVSGARPKHACALSVPGLSPRVETCACRRPGARDGTVRVWDVEAGRLRFMLQVCVMRV